MATQEDIRARRGAVNERRLPIRKLSGRESIRFRIVFEKHELETVESLLGVTSIRKMMFSGVLAPGRNGSWTLTGELGATVVQPCVATLRPVTTRVEERVERMFVPGLEPPPSATIVECSGGRLRRTDAGCRRLYGHRNGEPVARHFGLSASPRHETRGHTFG